MIVQCMPSETTAHLEQSQRKTAPSQAADPSWQRRFLELMPKIRRHAEIRFRALPAEAREEMVQETTARALLDYFRLVERGKEQLASAAPLAHFAVAQVRQGRRVGGRLNAQDVSSEYCRRRKGVTLQSLDSHDEISGGWREILMEDRQSTPADVAAARIDVSQWLKTLPGRSRRLAERLATGETTSGAARLFGISSGRVSQLRRELRRAWYTFQGEPDPSER